MRIAVITRCATCSITLVALCKSFDALAADRVYVAFDGVTLVADDVDDAAVDRTAIAQLAGTLPPFAGDAAKRQAVLASIRDDWSAYAIEIVDVRPDGDDWSMAVVTSTHPLGESVTGAAVLDCADARGVGEIVFAFADAGDDAIAIGATVSQELAHAYGLEHTDDPRDLVYPLATGGDAAFLDECVALVEGAACDHAPWCADGQNAHAELLDRLGPAVPDSGPPRIELVSPGDGEQIVAGVDLEVEIDADDDVRVDRVVLFEGDRELGEDRSPPWKFVVAAVPSGSYTLRARAIDHAGHEQDSEPIAITAIGSSVAPTGDISRGSDDAGCRVGDESTPALAWLVVAAVARRRRQRAVARTT